MLSKSPRLFFFLFRFSFFFSFLVGNRKVETKSNYLRFFFVASHDEEKKRWSSDRKKRSKVIYLYMLYENSQNAKNIIKIYVIGSINQGFDLCVCGGFRFIINQCNLPWDRDISANRGCSAGPPQKLNHPIWRLAIKTNTLITLTHSLLLIYLFNNKIKMCFLTFYHRRV